MKTREAIRGHTVVSVICIDLTSSVCPVSNFILGLMLRLWSWGRQPLTKYPPPIKKIPEYAPDNLIIYKRPMNIKFEVLYLHTLD